VIKNRQSPRIAYFGVICLGLKTKPSWGGEYCHGINLLYTISYCFILSYTVVGQCPTLKRRNTQVSILRRNGTRTSHWRLEVGGREKNNKD